MKNSILLFLALFSLTTTSLAQNLAWAKSMGGTSADMGHSIIVDDWGNIYSTGFFDNTVDFDPGIGTHYLTAIGGHDIYIQKLDSSGALLWVKSFGGNLDDIGWSIALDNLGNIYSTGSFNSTVDFDPGPGNSFLTTTAMSQDVYIQKLDSNGNFIWAKSMGGDIGYDIGYSTRWFLRSYSKRKKKKLNLVFLMHQKIAFSNGTMSKHKDIQSNTNNRSNQA